MTREAVYSFSEHLEREKERYHREYEGELVGVRKIKRSNVDLVGQGVQIGTECNKPIVADIDRVCGDDIESGENASSHGSAVSSSTRPDVWDVCVESKEVFGSRGLIFEGELLSEVEARGGAPSAFASVEEGDHSLKELRDISMLFSEHCDDVPDSS